MPASQAGRHGFESRRPLCMRSGPSGKWCGCSPGGAAAARLWLAALLRPGRIVFVLAVLTANSAHSASAQQSPPAPTRPPNAYEELQAFSSVLTQIRVNYVDSVTYRELVHAAINDSSVAGLKPADIALRLSGPKGSTVRIRIERGPRLEPETLSVTLRRELLGTPRVTMARMAAPATGYLDLQWFAPKAGDDVRDAVRLLQAQGARRLVLDLRNNPGGLMDAAVDIASEFLPQGALVFRTEGRKKDAIHQFVTKHDGAFRDMPVIVLINGQSASAAEALAGSLQDHDRALILGRRSFGKALVQTGFLIMPSSDIVELTIARVFTPSGRLIQRRYRGIRYEEYWAFAGKAGAAEDTLVQFKTDHGRTVGLELDERVLGRPGLPRERPVFLVADAAVAPLNQAAAWGEHASDRQFHDVRRRHDQEPRLHERLAETTPPEDEGTIMILQRAGERLGRTRALTVDQHDDRHVPEGTVVLGDELVDRVLLSAFRSKDERPLGEELGGDVNGRIHEAAGIISQVKDEAPRPLRLQQPHSVAHVIACLRGEPLQVQIPSGRGRHPCHRHPWRA